MIKYKILEEKVWLSNLFHFYIPHTYSFKQFNLDDSMIAEWY